MDSTALYVHVNRGHYCGFTRKAKQSNFAWKSGNKSTNTVYQSQQKYGGGRRSDGRSVDGADARESPGLEQLDAR